MVSKVDSTNRYHQLGWTATAIVVFLALFAGKVWGGLTISWWLVFFPLLILGGILVLSLLFLLGMFIWLTIKIWRESKNG